MLNIGYICGMKKKTIWLIAGVMGFSFLALLFLQLTYMDAMIKMKKEQLDESVNKALYQAARNLELNETLKYLEKEVNETERRAYKSDSVGTRSGHPDGQDHNDATCLDAEGDDTEKRQELHLGSHEIHEGDNKKQICLSEGFARRGGIQYLIHGFRQASEREG